MPDYNPTKNQIGDEVWRCGLGHDVLVTPPVPPYEMPLCPWCEVLRLRAALRDAITDLEGHECANIGGFEWYLEFRQS